MSIKAQLEALIYAAEDPISLDQMAALLKADLLALKTAPQSTQEPSTDAAQNFEFTQAAQESVQQESSEQSAQATEGQAATDQSSGDQASVGQSSDDQEPVQLATDGQANEPATENQTLEHENQPEA